MTWNCLTCGVALTGPADAQDHYYKYDDDGGHDRFRSPGGVVYEETAFDGFVQLDSQPEPECAGVDLRQLILPVGGDAV